MGTQTLNSRAVIGEYYLRLEQNPGLEWVEMVSNYFASDQESETYAWLGQSPVMREWIGGRHAKGFRENGISITNLHFEATLEIPVKDMRRDKTGQVMLRIAELADRTNAHWAKLLSTLILSGESTACYDGQYFFDTDHAEGDSGTQSNDISVDISTLPAATHGTATAPSVAEMQQVILQAVQQMHGFKDDQGEPINETARQFAVMLPTSLWNAGAAALRQDYVNGGDSSLVKSLSEYNIQPVVNPRLTWTDKLAVFRTDGNVRPLIRQEETAVSLKVIAEGSQLEFTDDVHQYGVDTWRNVGFGMWQGACLATMT